MIYEYSLVLLHKNIKSDYIIYADKHYGHSGIYDQSSLIQESCYLNVLIIEVLSFRNVYNNNNEGEHFQHINRQ